MKGIPITVFAVFLIYISGKAQTNTNYSRLQRITNELAKEYTLNHKNLLVKAKQNNWDLIIKSSGKRSAYLVGINQFNHPVYYTTFNNTIAAATVGTDKLWPNGSSGLNLSGASDSLKNKLAIWDGGAVLGTHLELKGRINQMDNAYLNMGEGSAHATHVTGTMMATGINPLVKGMSFGLKGIQAYDFFNDNTEMSKAASGLLLSNHSYGTICGWYQDTDGSWTFEGNNGDSVDYNFGYYNMDAATWDDIAYNAPYYLIVKATGNNRDVNGPSIGGTYYYYDINGTKISATRQAGISSNDGYDVIGTSGNAKNILTIGAVKSIVNGYTSPSDVIMTTYSDWGPTDDGRIKPDLVADGESIYSTSSANDSDYEVESGTSMSTASVTGSLLLLQDYYGQLQKGKYLRAATLKALAIHTADEAGDNPGPDYKFGWGLLDMNKAADLITESVKQQNDTTSKHLLIESSLTNNSTNYLKVKAGCGGIITATVSWTDPKGLVETVNVLNNKTPKLINDLDVRIVRDTDKVIFYPWVLNPMIPSAAATKGDNHVDNVEKVEVDSAIPGTSYSIMVSNKGTLLGGKQAYSLIVSGVGGNKFCETSQDSAFNPIVYPNPCNQYFNLKFYINNTSNVSVRLVSINGKTVLNEHYTSQKGLFMKQIDTQSIASGVYILETMVNNTKAVKKILLIH